MEVAELNPAFRLSSCPLSFQVAKPSAEKFSGGELRNWNIAAQSDGGGFFVGRCRDFCEV
jgi:hypothetical protein